MPWVFQPHYQRDLSKRWCPRVEFTDAALGGWGRAYATVPRELVGCGPSLCRHFAMLQRQGQQTLPLGQLHMSPCLKVLVFLAPQCGSARTAHRTAPSRAHRRARTVALGSREVRSCEAGSCGAEELGAGELRSWEAAGSYTNLTTPTKPSWFVC